MKKWRATIETSKSKRTEVLSAEGIEALFPLLVDAIGRVEWEEKSACVGVTIA